MRGAGSENGDSHNSVRFQQFLFLDMASAQDLRRRPHIGASSSAERGACSEGLKGTGLPAFAVVAGTFKQVSEHRLRGLVVVLGRVRLQLGGLRRRWQVGRGSHRPGGGARRAAQLHQSEWRIRGGVVVSSCFTGRRLRARVVLTAHSQFEGERRLALARTCWQFVRPTTIQGYLATSTGMVWAAG